MTEEGPPTPTPGPWSILKLRGDPEATGMSMSPNSLSGVQNLGDFRNDRVSGPGQEEGVCVCARTYSDMCTHMTQQTPLG